MFSLDIVHLSYLYTTERCVEIGVMYTTPCSLSFSLFFIIPPLQKVSGQQIFERSIKDFFWNLLFTSMVKGKQIQKNQKHGSQCALPQFYFYFIFIFERQTIFYFQKVFIFIVHQIFVFSAKLAQSWDKTAWTWTKRHFATYSLWALKGNLCLLCMACIFFLLMYVPSLGMFSNGIWAWRLTHRFWKFSYRG